MELPTLYTLTSSTGTRYWKIAVTSEESGVYICREYGKYGGKAIINRKLITESKSKATPYDQAVFEANGDWKEKKDKKGYIEDLKTLSTTESQLTEIKPEPNVGVSETEPKVGVMKSCQSIVVVASTSCASTSSAQTQHVPTSGAFKFLPMLANKFIERKKYVVYPCLGQPKLDGVRYTAHKVSDSEVVLKTRNDAVCPFFMEIKSAISQLNLDPNVRLDGEFYSKRIPFRTLNGYCNRKKMEGKTGYQSIPKEDLETIQYYIFDCYFINDPKKSFGDRYDYLRQLLGDNTSQYLTLVPIYHIDHEKEIKPLHDQFVVEGFEGIMIRNIGSPYKLKDRSNDLLKFKSFFDNEFTIVGAKCPTNGKEEGCIIWELKLADSDATFSCRPRDTYESRKEDWLEYCQRPEQFIGREYTVRYQETYENGIPRFPTGVAIRYDI
jgi:DNA ligase-1